MSQYFNLRDWFGRMRVVNAERPPDLYLSEDGKIILTAAAPSRMIFPIPAGAGRSDFPLACSNAPTGKQNLKKPTG